MDELDFKYQALQEELRRIGRVAVAFSAGVDSTLLLRVAHDVLGDGAIGMTVRFAAMPSDDFVDAARFCKEAGIRHLVCDIDELAIPGFRENPPDRCYHCKRAIFTRLTEEAQAAGFPQVVEGSNTDDLSDYRPGRRALDEMGIQSPLLKAGLSKAEIRLLSERLGLPTAAKPSAACLASRFAYGEQITREGLVRVDAAERFLHEQGFAQARVRVHGNLARIEVQPALVPDIARKPLRGELLGHLRKLGFAYVTVDLAGYRTGSMNEVL